jgi:hypothetical protein
MINAPTNVEKSRFWHQKMPAKFDKIKSQLLARPALFENQGSVAATWRKHGNARLGPYFILRYFENGVRRSIYLGRSEQLAQEVRRLLENLQFHRISRRLRAKIRKSLHLQKKQLQNNLHALGYYIKGFEIHKAKSPQKNVLNL